MEIMGVSDNYSLPPGAVKIINMLNEAGFDAYAVGGAVRDMVMGKEPHDFDITTSAKPDEIKKVFSGFRCIETGIRHGTVTVISDSVPYEITAFRIDGDYSDRRRPDGVIFTGRLEDDLSRRDFTCNALAFHPVKGITDLFGGAEDIRNKIIRCVGDPDKRFGEDALRIMRALRFSSVLGFEIDSETEKSIHKNRELLKFISNERIFSELCKLLEGKNAAGVLSAFGDVIFTVMPELEPMKDLDQQNPAHRYDVWNHTLHAVDNIRPDRELRLAMLFHDSGKPYTKTVDENGIGHFYGHAEISVKIARMILNNMKASNRLKNHVCTLVENHGLMPEKMSKKTFKKYIGKLGEDTVRELYEVRKADVTALDSFLTPKFLSENERAREIFEQIISEQKCFTLKDLAVDGADLISLGFEPSRSLGEVLRILLDEVMDNKIKNEKEALLSRAGELLNEYRNSQDK